MVRHDYGVDGIVNRVPRDDGVVHFRVALVSKPIGERLCQWTLASLWFLVGAVLVATAISF